MKELLKYPILVLSIIIGIVILDHFEYNIISLGPSGIEVEKRITTTLVDAKALSMKVDSLERLISVLAVLPTSSAEAPWLKSNKDNVSGVKPSITFEHPYALYTASDLTTKFNKSIEEISKSTIIVGWVWIREYRSITNNWSEVVIKEAGEIEPFDKAPVSLTKGDAIVATTNLNRYDSLPESNQISSKPIGIVGKSSLVEIQQKPVTVSSNTFEQYWIKVKYEV